MPFFIFPSFSFSASPRLPRSLPLSFRLLSLFFFPPVFFGLRSSFSAFCLSLFCLSLLVSSFSALLVLLRGFPLLFCFPSPPSSLSLAFLFSFPYLYSPLTFLDRFSLVATPCKLVHSTLPCDIMEVFSCLPVSLVLSPLSFFRCISASVRPHSFVTVSVSLVYYAFSRLVDAAKSPCFLELCQKVQLARRACPSSPLILCFGFSRSVLAPASSLSSCAICNILAHFLSCIMLSDNVTGGCALSRLPLLSFGWSTGKPDTDFWCYVCLCHLFFIAHTARSLSILLIL